MYTQLYAWENLQLAWRKAARGKHGQANVAAFEYRLEENLLSLQESLRTHSYQPGSYTSFYVHEPKRRLISAAPFSDRVVHHTLCNLLEPIFERSFIADSYANRKHKGTHRALDRAQNFARRFPYVLQLDFRQFFPSIDHAILRHELARKIDDVEVLWLIDQILASGDGLLGEVYEMVYFPGDDLFAVNRPRGLPIGNLTSQFWANCYLNPFDHFIKRELGCPAYLRFVDDLLLFGETKTQLWEWNEAIAQRIERFRLTTHAGTHPRPVGEGFPFLGFIVQPWHRRLKRRKGIYFRRLLYAQIRAWRAGKQPLSKTNESVIGWVAHVEHGNTIGLRKAIFSMLG